MRVKSVVGVSSGALAACVAVAFSALSASAVSQTVTLTSAQTVALFGSTIQCQYLTRPGGVDTWETGTFTYLVTENWANLSSYNGTGYEYYSPDGQDFSQRQICLYGMTYPADLSISANSVAMLKLQTAVDLSAVDYLDTAIIQNTGSTSLLDIDSTPYAGLGVNFLHTDFGNFGMLRRGASGTNEYNYAGFVRNSIGVKCTITPIYLNSASLQAASIGWAQCSCIRNSDNRIIIGIVTPILSADWVLEGSSGAGEGSFSTDSGSSGGSSGGSSVDLSEILDKLDTIISLMQSNNINSGSNQVTSSIDKLNSTMNPDYDSSRYSDAGNAQGNYLNAESQLLGNSTFGLDNLDSLDLTFDATMTAEKVSLLDIFFDNSLLIQMIGIVIAVGIISFVIFGKWV